MALFARRADRLDQIAAGLDARGSRTLAFAGDVTQEADITAFVERTVAVLGRLDVMICNAGIGYHGALDETPPSAMRRLVDVNLMGTLYAAHAAMMVFRRQGSGHLIAVSSIVGRRGVSGSSVYTATKAAQVGFIESLRADFVGTPFHASVVLPVGTQTEFREAIERDFGHATSGTGPRQSADAVARAIVDCVISPKAEVYPHAASRLLAILNVVAPGTTDRIVQRYSRRRKPTSPHADPPA